VRSTLLILGLLITFSSVAMAQPPDGARPGAGGGLGQRQLPPRDAIAGEALRGTSVIRGTVVAADNGSPIRRAQVRIGGQGAQGRLATTDAQGRFELRDLPAGRYTVSASKGGFVSVQYGQRRPSESGTPLEIGDGQALEKVVIALPRGSVISGRITDEFGEPVANAVVGSLRYGYAGGARRLMPAGGQNARDTTDDQGHFRLFGLSPGDYIISASFRSGGGEATDPSGENTGYAPTYYPGTSTVADAQRVTVALGQEQTSVIFSLIATRLVRVSGAVLNSQGTPMQNGAVMLTPASTRVNAPALNSALSGRIDGSGQFRVLNVPPGRYVAQVRTQVGRGGPAARGANVASAEFGRQEITVGAEDLNGVVLLTGPGARVTGQIVTDTGVVPSIRAQQLTVMARPVQLDPSSPAGGVGRVNDDFTFELNGVFDARVFRLNAPQGWNLKSVLLNGQDVTDVPLELPPAQTVSGMQIVITERTTDLSGRVTDARSRPVTDVTVVIFPADEDKWMYQSRFVRAARPDQDGRYEIRGLPPSGDYLAIAVQGLEDGQAGDPEFLATVRDHAAKLSLGEGETRALDLRFAQE
jgi:protocatechuate 3,4-dioxygenase beta subunit